MEAEREGGTERKVEWGDRKRERERERWGERGKRERKREREWVLIRIFLLRDCDKFNCENPSEGPYVPPHPLPSAGPPPWLVVWPTWAWEAWG